MARFAHRLLHRLAAPLVHAVDERLHARQSQLVASLERLEKRLDKAVAQGQADLRLITARVGAADARRPPRLGARVTRTLNGAAAAPGPATVSIPGDLLELTHCSVCGCADSTPVCEFNSMLLVATPPDAAAMRSDYAVCHGCGILFARRRPVGPRFRYLVEHFEDSIGRDSARARRATNILSSRHLSDDDVRQLKAYAAEPMFVSDLPENRDRVHLPNLLRDRLAVAAHVEIIGSLVPLTAPRVLEIRPRFGAIGAALRRLYGGDTCALPIFEVQQLIVREVYGTRADHRLDYDAFEIPYEGTFDLVVANHLLTHAVHPARVLDVIRRRLAPGGHLYLYNEPDDTHVLDEGKPIFRALNSFHLQTFDTASLDRALRATGFEPVYIGHYNDNCVALARVAPEGAAWARITPRDLKRRIRRYVAARDRGVLALPESLRSHFAGDWDAIVERAFAAGVVEFDGDGHLRLVK